MKIFFTLSQAIFVLLFLANISNAQKNENGIPCTNSNECASGYCSNQLQEGKVVGTHLCMAVEANCPIPGGWGVMYEGEYNFGGTHWYCTRGVGIQNDGGARDPEFRFGGGCSGFWEKIDCRGEWFPLVSDGIKVYCAAAARDPYSAAFCAAAEITAHQYGQQIK